MPANELFKILDSIDSTNNYAMATIRAGMAKHGQAILAMEQTAGKGQRGKNWQSKKGQNIAISIILKTEMLEIAEQNYLNLLVALAANDFLKTLIDKNLSIKWPNDLYWRDRKAGGILIENVFQGTKWNWAVVGIGINVNQESFNRLLPNPVSIKQITGREYDIVESAKRLHQIVIERIESAKSTLPQKILKEYNKNLYKLNEEVRLKKANAVFTTKIKGVNIHGQLLTRDVMDRHFDFGEVVWMGG